MRLMPHCIILGLVLPTAAFAQTPTISAVGPNWTTVGTSQPVTVVGANFVAGVTQCSYRTATAMVLPCTGVNVTSGSLLTAVVPGASAVDTGVLTVANGAAVASTAFQTRSAGTSSPVLSSISPNSLVAGSGSVTATATGAFVTGAQYFMIPPSLLAPVSLSVSAATATSIQMTVPAALVQQVGRAYIYGVSPGAVSTRLLPFDIRGPSITAISPASVTVGSGAVPLQVNGDFPGPGTGDTPASVVFAQASGNTSLTVTARSATQLTATLPASLLTTPGTAGVRVVIPFAVSSLTSNTVTFIIGAPSPAISGVSPAVVAQGSANQEFTLSGQSLAPISSLTFTPPGGAAAALAPSMSTSNQIRVTVPASLMATAGTASFSLVTLGGPSNSVNVTIAAPTISSVSPAGGVAGDPSTTIALAGSWFTVAGLPTVRFTAPGGVATPVTIIGSPTATSVVATVPASLLINAGTASIVVQSGTAASVPVSFSIVAACSGHGTRSGGVCTCAAGYAGALCDGCATGYFSYPTCRFCTAAASCNGQGTCDSSGLCVCGAAFQGAACDACAADHYGYPTCRACLAARDCGGRGSCNSSGLCVCTAGYAGHACQYSDAVTCSGHGVAQNNGTCLCDRGRAGTDCTQFDCNPVTGLDCNDNDACTIDACSVATGCAHAGSCVDGGAADAGADGGDEGGFDAGVTDAGLADAGETDAGTTDAGVTDAAVADAGHDARDGGVNHGDGGEDGEGPPSSGCGCGGASGGPGAMLTFAFLLTALSRGSRKRRGTGGDAASSRVTSPSDSGAEA